MLVVGIACLNCVSFLSHRVLPAKIEYCSFYGELYDCMERIHIPAWFMKHGNSYLLHYTYMYMYIGMHCTID